MEILQSPKLEVGLISPLREGLLSIFSYFVGHDNCFKASQISRLFCYRSFEGSVGGLG
jgi:hypothetical protein